MLVFNDQIVHGNFREKELEELKRNNIEYAGYPCKTEDDLLKYAKDADIIFDQGRMNITKRVIYNLPKLKAILRRGIGYDNVDVKAAAEKGIIVSNTPGFCAEEVSTHATSLLLSFVRKIPKYHNLTREGKWLKEDTTFGYDVGSIQYDNVGIIGFGSIGSMIYEKLEPFKTYFYIFDPFKKLKEKKNLKQVSLEELLEKSKFIILCCTFCENNIHMIDQEQFNLMREDAVIINVGRGRLINEEVLIKYLKNKKIEGAALDVFEQEPLDTKSPLMTLDNVILAPHNGGVSSKSLDLSYKMSLDEIIRIATGKAPACRVN